MKAAELDMYARTYVPPYRLPVVDRLKKAEQMKTNFQHLATFSSEESKDDSLCDDEEEAQNDNLKNRPVRGQAVLGEVNTTSTMHELIRQVIRKLYF